LELSMNNPAIAAEFKDLGEMLIHTRIAADLAGATPMDRPEWATVAPDGRVYFALTNNSRRTPDSQVQEWQPGRVIDRGPDAANPLGPNADGHIIRWTETGGHTGTGFEWDIFVFAQDTHGTEESFSDPDGLWADPDGRLFIETDGGQKDGLQNQILVADTETGEIRRLFTGPPGCEITGLTMTPDRRTMFINVQHPGNGDPDSSSFPYPTGSGRVPRDSTVVISRKDGGIVGS
jgi:secreted PhoX family phosphatase